MGCVIAAIRLSIYVWMRERQRDPENKHRWWVTYPAIPIGGALMLIFDWTLILWAEMVVNPSNIVSDTDMIAARLSIAQIVTLLAPKLWAPLPPTHSEG